MNLFRQASHFSPHKQRTVGPHKQRTDVTPVHMCADHKTAQKQIGERSVLFLRVKRGMADDGNPPDGPKTAKQKIGESSVLF